jgi:hypothetical protein
MDLTEKAKGIRLDSRNIKVKLPIVPSQEVREQMFQLLKTHACPRAMPIHNSLMRAAPGRK